MTFLIQIARPEIKVRQASWMRTKMSRHTFEVIWHFLMLNGQKSTHIYTHLQQANITQYVQHSHFSNTKKDKETDALQWTASAG